ncbi:MAG: transglycosylase domain-containing protein [Patescibacteria group bacterium]
MPIPHLKEPTFRIRKIGERAAGRVRRRQDAARKPSGPKWKRVAKRTLMVCGILVGAGIIGGIGVFAWYSRDLPDPDKIIERTVAESTKIYARDGVTLLYEIHGDEKRTLIQLEDIPELMRQATIAMEDQDFYEHKGFDLPGIIKAGCHEIFGNLGGLCPQRGGSTITQQFVKNAILTSEHSYTRKIKELVLSYQLEQKLTKDEILQLYFNEIPFGSTLYGVEAAAQTFLGKSIHDVTLSEAAFLAAIPNRPTYYSPYGNHTEELSTRLHLVLNEMVEMGFITAEEAEEAKKDNILERMRPQYENITAPHFVMYVREQLSTRYGEKVIEQGGLKVITTLNIDKQRVAEEVIREYAEKNYLNYNASNAALVSLDTKTGQILAMVGSKDYFDDTIDGNVNVTLRPRQPGSSLKPLVYLAAFEKGYTPDTILFDLVTKFKTDAQDYEPKNYDLVEHGPLSMRNTLAGSLNIPAVKTLYLAGIDNVLDIAERFGYSTFQDRSRFGLSLVLGGGEVTLLEHTSAFATFAREGIRHPVSAILSVEDSGGKILEEYEEREEEVFDKEAVRTLNNVLSDNGARAYIFGSSNYLTLPDRPVAAKTGTTNDYRDAWTLGYTPSIATGVWVGNNDNSEMRRGADGSIVAAPIWREFMKRTVGGPAEPFNSPTITQPDKPILRGELEGGVTLTVDSTTGKVIPNSCLDTYPKEFQEEKTFRTVHTILHYVDRNNPLGPVPADPTVDPQYVRWEEPVARWAAENGYVENIPAEEDCNLRSDKNKPTVSITAPKKNATLTARNVTVTVSAKATSPRTIKEITFSLDGKLIGSTKTSPYTLTLTLPENTKAGFHDIKADIFDDISNTRSDTITINYLPSASGTTINTNTVNTNTSD